MFCSDAGLAMMNRTTRDARAANERHRVNEQRWVRGVMDGFEPEQSVPWLYLTWKYGSHITKPLIVSLGQVCADELKLPLVRGYKRRKETMLKWFTLHWDIIYPFIETKLEVIR
jgi:hypothetical protein